MSDLHCAATLLVTRHAEASYVETCFSDEGGWLSPEGREQARDLADRLAGRRIARVWSSDTSRAVQTAEVAAARLGLSGGSPVVAHKALREVDAGDLAGQPFDVARLHAVTDQWFAGDLTQRFAGGESGEEVVARIGTQLRAIADEHRGETVLVVGHQLALSVTLASYGGAGTGFASRLLDHAEVVEVRVDGDAVLVERG